MSGLTSDGLQSVSRLSLLSAAIHAVAHPSFRNAIVLEPTLCKGLPCQLECIVNKFPLPTYPRERHYAPQETVQEPQEDHLRDCRQDSAMEARAVCGTAVHQYI